MIQRAGCYFRGGVRKLFGKVTSDWELKNEWLTRQWAGRGKEKSGQVPSPWGHKNMEWSRNKLQTSVSGDEGLGMDRARS